MTNKRRQNVFGYEYHLTEGAQKAPILYIHIPCTTVTCTIEMFYRHATKIVCLSGLLRKFQARVIMISEIHLKSNPFNISLARTNLLFIIKQLVV